MKHNKLESKKLSLRDYEEAFKKIFTETKEVDLDKLVRNFIQSKSQLKTTKATEVVYFLSEMKICCDLFTLG